MDRSIDVHCIKRYKNLRETSVDETERRTIQRLLDEEEAGASPLSTNDTAGGIRSSTTKEPLIFLPLPFRQLTSR
jgi:hypothetical protein